MHWGSPSITNFGDESHEEGESGLTIDGAGLGPFAGTVWMYANSDRTGSSDQLTVADESLWTDMQIPGVSIPASPNNSPGTVYLFVQRSDLAWSFPYEFTLVAAGNTKDVTPATETDSVVALTGTFHVTLTAATETDTAVALTGIVHQALSITAATETDTSVALVQGVTTWYVRPSTTPGTYGNEDGTSYDDAWNGSANIDWTASGVQPGHTLYGYGDFSGEVLEPGDSGTSGSPIIIDLTNATLEHYDTSTTSGDWTEVSAADPTSPSPGSNFWVLDLGTTLNDVPAVWFGSGFQKGTNVRYWTANTTTVTDVTAGNVPSAQYEFDFFRGSGADKTLIGVYSENNPVTDYTEIHYATDNNHRGIDILNQEYITINGGDFSKCGEAIRLRNTVNSTTLQGIIIDGVSFENVSTGIMTSAVGTARYYEDVEIKNSSFTDCARTGIYLRSGVLGSNVYSNTFTRAGWARSQGGIYTAGTGTVGNPHNIYLNTFSGCYSGRYWASDGGGVDTDAGTNYVSQYRNRYIDCWQAWHDNSGGKNEFYTNVLSGCSMISQHTDSGANNALELLIVANVAASCTADDTHNDSAQDLGSILKVGNLTCGASGVVVKNNLITGAAGTEDALMRHDNLVSSNDWHEDYNCIWNVSNEVVDTSSNAESQGANAQNVNPSLDANYRATNALLVGAGVAVAGVTTDYDGNTFSDPPTIGAFEMEGRLSQWRRRAMASLIKSRHRRAA